MNLAIIIVTYNSAHLIEACVTSLGKFRQNVLVVDNGSVDGTSALLKTLGIPVILNNTNLGFSRAANIGARETRAECLCFLNPDCAATPSLFIKGLEKLADNPKRCVVPEKIKLENVTIRGIQPGYTRKKLLCDMIEINYSRNGVAGLLRGHLRYHDNSWHWPLGTCLFVHRDFFLSLKGFDERYFMYYEDVDLGKRIMKAGGEIVSINFELEHDQEKHAGDVTARKIRLLNEGRMVYARMHYGPLFTLILRIALFPVKLMQSNKAMSARTQE